MYVIFNWMLRVNWMPRIVFLLLWTPFYSVVGGRGEWLRQRVNAGARTDMVTGERLMARASPGDRCGSQVPYTVGAVVETSTSN